MYVLKTTSCHIGHIPCHNFNLVFYLAFSVFLPCSGLKSGIASFTVGLLIETRKGKPLQGTPLRLKLRKECFERNPDVECNKKCGNGGWCNNEKTCQCKEASLQFIYRSGRIRNYLTCLFYRVTWEDIAKLHFVIHNA